MVQRELETGIMFALVGPTGSGKGTLGSRLLQEYQSELELSVSATSRSPRQGEQDGREYHFMTREAFEEKVAIGAFFEWEETHGHLYGTLQETIAPCLSGARNLLLDIDIRGAFHFQKHFPQQLILVFLLPPNFSVLEERIRGRARMTDDEVARRLETARQELHLAESTVKKQCLEGTPKIDYLVVNEDRKQAYREVKAIYDSEKCRTSRVSPKIFDELEA